LRNRVPSVEPRAPPLQAREKEAASGQNQRHGLQCRRDRVGRGPRQQSPAENPLLRAVTNPPPVFRPLSPPTANDRVTVPTLMGSAAAVARHTKGNDTAANAITEIHFHTLHMALPPESAA